MIRQIYDRNFGNGMNLSSPDINRHHPSVGATKHTDGTKRVTEQKSNPVLEEFKTGDKRNTVSVFGDRTIRKAEDKILSGKLYQRIPARKGHRTAGKM